MKIRYIEIPNPVFREKKLDVADIEASAAEDNTDLLTMLRANKRDINEKQMGHISSFNFSREVFNSNRWTELSKIARGLFIDNQTGEIIARGYEKFFNYKEKSFNTPVWLKEHLKFPVAAYEKSNGFLGLLTYDKVESKLAFCSKSCISTESAESTFPELFKSIFYELYGDRPNEWHQRLMTHLVENGTCLLFEVIDPVNDPHIVEYSSKKIVLLDEVKLTREFESTPYEELCKLAETFGLEVKKLHKTFSSWEELDEFMSGSLPEYAEGFVFEDADKYHFKLKTSWYNFWKGMRAFKYALAAGHNKSTSGLTTPLANKVYAFMRDRFSREELEKLSIIDIRNKFYKGDSNAE